MSQTISQIVARAARQLGKKPTGQAVSGVVSADLTQAYAEVWESLARLNLVTWDADDSIPNEYAMPIVSLVARSRVNETGVSEERRQRILLESSSAVQQIAGIKSGIWENSRGVEDF